MQQTVLHNVKFAGILVKRRRTLHTELGLRRAVRTCRAVAGCLGGPAHFGTLKRIVNKQTLVHVIVYGKHKRAAGGAKFIHQRAQS
jgi:hypothetical protein